MKELSKAEAAQSGCSVDVAKATSALPMTKMAGTLGCDSGFDHGRCERHEVGLFRPEDSERSRGKRGSSVG